MTQAIDLTNLHEITGGDIAVECELFDVFLQSSEECIAGLKSSLDVSKHEDWRKQAHAFKGTSLNLGAFELGRLCKEAQDNSQASLEQKHTMLAAIETEYDRVKAQLDKERRAAH
jgi:HPt (histidine-containing phosphotransfer) domain-containing protein